MTDTLCGWCQNSCINRTDVSSYQHECNVARGLNTLVLNAHQCPVCGDYINCNTCLEVIEISRCTSSACLPSFESVPDYQMQIITPVYLEILGCLSSIFFQYSNLSQIGLVTPARYCFLFSHATIKQQVFIFSAFEMKFKNQLNHKWKFGSRRFQRKPFHLAF